ncbi:MAG: hypothetical protein OXG46_14490 [Chloroflexi bacterium]|nr:hypothetical protein [Chloroflexota bacterium]MCY3939092.1 hypothetical protein [Chloroflexota bacterium]
MKELTDRAASLVNRPAPLIFVFLAAVYLLTMGVNRGGFGYSPDGQFAFEMAKSIALDPDREYLRRHYRNFSRWGVAMPALLTPIVALARPLAEAAPQRDRLTVDGHEYVVSHFPEIGVDPETEIRHAIKLHFPQGRYSEMTLISHLGLSAAISQGVEVVSIRITDADGGMTPLPVRAGIESAEWAYERADVRNVIQHERVRVAGNHIGNTRANFYFHRFEFDSPIDVRSAEIVYTGPPGRFYLATAGFRDADSGEIVDVSGSGRVWSARQNREFFLRFWSPVLSVVLTAATAVLLFKVVRILGYGSGVALALSLVYGLATMAWPYAKFDFSEPSVTFFLMGGVWAALRYGDALRLRYAVLTGLWGLAAVFAKYVAVIALPGILLQLVMSHKRTGTSWARLPARTWKPAIAFAAPFVLVVVPTLVFLAVVLDFRLLYEEELIGGIQRGWFAVPLALGVKGLLISWGKGLFLYNPILLISIPASIWFARRHGWRSLVFFAIPIAYLLLYSKKEVWYGGNAWGPRYLVPTLPLLVCMAAPAFQWIGAQRRRWAALGAGVLIAISVVPQILGISKDFDQYLGLYADQIVWQLPENGGVYGGSEYQRWSAKQPEGDLAAVLFAPQFTPLLGHLWLLRADVTELLLPDRLDLVQDALGRAPWNRFGIDAFPARPQDGLGLDFWSMTMWANYYNHKVLVGIVMGALIVVQIVALVSLGLLLRSLPVTDNVSRGLRNVTLAGAALVFLAFDTLHFML